MSDSHLQDGFSSALAKIERLLEDWGDLSTDKAKEIGVRYLLIQGVKALTLPHMNTRYSITTKAIERLAAFRQRITHLNIRDKSVERNVEALVITMIDQRANAQLVRRDSFLLSKHVPWESRGIEVLDEWLVIRSTLVTSFGTYAAVVEQVDHAIHNMTDEFLDGWASDDAGIMVRALELCEKLKALSTVTLCNQFHFEWTLNKLRRPKSCSTPAESAKYGQDVQGKGKRLTTTIVSLEQEVQALQLVKNDLISAVGNFDQQLDGLRLSHATLSSHEALLMKELETRLLHVETCEKNNELEKQKATSSKRFAHSKKTLQGTVHKLKEEIGVLQLTLIAKIAFIISHREVYDIIFQSERLKTKELLAEAEEDLATTKKTNDQLIIEQKGLQDSLATLLREKAAGAEECKNLNDANAALKSSIKLSHRMIARLQGLCDELEDKANTRRKEKLELASANARLKSSLSKAKDENAELSESIKKLEADGAEKNIELAIDPRLMGR